MSQAYITNNEHTQEKWNELVEALRERRFFLKKNIDLFEYFIKGVNKIEINEKDVFYRARRGNYSEDNKLNAPSADKVKSGRLNPPGIPYLYIGDSEDTVVSEVRPWIGSEVTLAKFQPVKQLSVADFVAVPTGNKNDYRKIIDKNFSKPVGIGESGLDYLSTQVISEYIKDLGYDGIRYSSSVNPDGFNIAIFNPENMNNCGIYKVVAIKEIKLKFEP